MNKAFYFVLGLLLLANFNMLAQVAQVQVIHNSADPAAEFVDVYVNGDLAIDDFEFRTATPFLELPSGLELNLGIAPSTSDSVTDVIANFPVTLEENEKYVVMATGVLDPSTFDNSVNGDEIAFTLKILAPAQTEGSSADNVDLAVYHGSTDAPTVDVLTGGTILIDDLLYGNFSDGYLSVPAASYILDVTPGDANDVIVASFEADISALGGGAAVVFASGFLDPTANQDGKAFGLFAALPDGVVVPLPQVVEPDPAMVQVVHNAADPAAEFVDVYVNGELAIDDFAFRTATPFLELPSGVELNLGIAPGSSSSSDDVIANFPITLEENQKYVVVANGVLDPSSFDSSVNGDDIGFTLRILTPAQTEGSSTDKVNLAVYHGATDAPAVDVLTGGNILIDDIAFGEFTDGYLSVPAASYILDVTPANANDVVVASFEADVSALGGGAAVVLASGFLDPTANQDGEAFGLLAVLADGTAILLPQVVEPDPALVQVVHNAADPAAEFVDVYVNGELAIDDFAFRSATPFIELPSGVELNLGIAPGSSSSSDDVIANFPVTLEENQKYVVVANGVLDPPSFDSSVNGDDIGFTLRILTPAQTEGSSPDNVDLAVYHGATDAPAVDVLTGGNILIDDLSFGEFTDGYLSVPAAGYILDVTPANANDVIVASFEADVSALGGGAAVVLASGFLDPTANQDGEAFGLLAVLADGTAILLPQVIEEEPKIVSFTLIDAETDAPIPGFDPLENGTVIAADELPSGSFNVRANIAEGESVGSVTFVVTDQDGKVRTRTESAAPYAAFGDIKGDYREIGVHPGDVWTIEATPFSEKKGNGEEFVSSGVSFSFIETAPGGLVQVVHNSPDPGAAEVDIYLNGELAIDDFAFRTATPFIKLPSDVALEIGVAAGNSTSAADILATFPVTLVDGEKYIVMATGVLDPSAFDSSVNGDDIAFTLQILTPARMASENGNNVDLAVYHGSTDAPAVDVLTAGNILVDDISYGNFTDGYLSVPAAKYILDITPGNDNDNVLASYIADVSGLGGGAGLVFASGFLAPDANQDGAAFGLFAVLPDGTVIELPLASDCDNDIVSFSLIDSETDEVIEGFEVLEDGVEINLSDLPSDQVAIRANVCENTNVGSVLFELSGSREVRRTENVAPYALFGDSQGHYFPWRPTPPEAGESYALTATVFSGPKKSGTEGGSLTINFSFTEDEDSSEEPGDGEEPSEGTALVQVIHNAADPAAEEVDIYINGDLAIDDFTFRTATPFIELPSGIELIIGVAGGNSSSAADVLAEFPVTLEEGEKYVVMATGVLNPAQFNTDVNGEGIAFTLKILTPAQTEAENDDNVDIAVFHGSTDAPTVDVLTAGNIIVDDLSYGNFTDGYLSVPAAEYILDITPGNANETNVASFIAPLTDQGGKSIVVFATGFLNPANNQAGENFGLFVAFADGGVIGLPQVIDDGSDEGGSTAEVQVIHNSADPAAEKVDIYLDGELAVDDFEFRTATPFIELPAGVEIEIGIAGGNSTSASDILATFPVTLAEDEKYVVVATGVLDPSSFDSSVNGDAIGFTLQILTPAQTESQNNNNIALAVYHGSTDAPSVDVLTGGATLIDDLAYGTFTDGYLSVPEGTYVLDVTPANANEIVVGSYTADLNGLGGAAAVVFASGFLNPDVNQHGAGFGLFAALPDGTVVELPQDCEQSITSFSLINAETDEVIKGYSVIDDGEVIDLADLPTDQLNIIANICNGASVGSVKLELIGSSHQSRIENKAPYALFGDSNGDFGSWNPIPQAGDSFTLSGIAFDEPNGKGNAHSPTHISFSFINSNGFTGGITQKLSVFPNPTTTGQVQVVVSNEVQNGQADVIVRDVSGNIKFSTRLNANNRKRLNLNRLREGLYFIQVIGKDFQASERIMIQK